MAVSLTQDERKAYDESITIGAVDKVPTMVVGWRRNDVAPATVAIHQMEGPFNWAFTLEAGEARTFAAALIEAANAAES